MLGFERKTNLEPLLFCFRIKSFWVTTSSKTDQPLLQSGSRYYVSFPNQLLSIELFVIIVEKGVKDFTQLTVIPLAYARSSLCQGTRNPFQIFEFSIRRNLPPLAPSGLWLQNRFLHGENKCPNLHIRAFVGAQPQTLYSIYICV